MPEAPAAPTGSVRQLRYEGFPLEAVLARVHEAHGADVTITAADRVRRGGIGGFFAREVFQVTVTVPEDTVERHDDDLTFVPLGRIGVFDDDRPVVLDDFPDDAEIDPEDIPGALALTGTPERDALDAEIWELLAQAAMAPAAEPLPVESAPPFEPVAIEPAVVEPPAAVEVVEPIRSSGPIASTTLIPAAPVPVPVVPAPVVFPAMEAPAPAPEATPEPASVDLGALIERFEPHWRAPGLPTSGVIAVVGARAEALRVAGALATSIGVEPDDVIVATPPVHIVVPTEAEAVRLAATTRFRCRPLAVIVVELLPGREGHEWARVVLEGLRAEQVRLAVDTSALVAQQHHGIAAIGGVDVIDLLGAALHPDPALALGAPAPIGTIDGRAATPEMWAATVLATGSAAGSAGDLHRPLRDTGSVVS